MVLKKVVHNFMILSTVLFSSDSQAILDVVGNDTRPSRLSESSSSSGSGSSSSSDSDSSSGSSSSGSSSDSESGSDT